MSLGKSHVSIHQVKYTVATVHSAWQKAASIFCQQHKKLLLFRKPSEALAVCKDVASGREVQVLWPPLAAESKRQQQPNKHFKWKKIGFLC